VSYHKFPNNCFLPLNSKRLTETAGSSRGVVVGVLLLLVVVVVVGVELLDFEA
jgi:hypothetical protein